MLRPFVSLRIAVSRDSKSIFLSVAKNLLWSWCHTRLGLKNSSKNSLRFCTILQIAVLGTANLHSNPQTAISAKLQEVVRNRNSASLRYICDHFSTSPTAKLTLQFRKLKPQYIFFCQFFRDYFQLDA